MINVCHPKETELVKSELEKTEWDFIDSKSNSFNNIHPYPAKFIPEIPRKLMEIFPILEGSYILDPFCGSGVTLLEAKKLGYNSIGVDINPIACLISRVKVNPLPDDFVEVAERIIKIAREEISNALIPPIQNLDHWFKKEIQSAIASIKNQIDKTNDNSLADALNYCLSAIIVKVSNQDSDTRYAAREKKITQNDVFALFHQATQKLLKAKRNESAIISDDTESIVMKINSLSLSKQRLNKKIGAVITSPPYPNAYEYWLYHKYRMWWLGYDAVAVKKQEIGARAHYFKKNRQTVEDFILQMNHLFEKFKDLLIDDAYIAFVIGKSKIHGEIIDNEKIIENAGMKNGFSFVTTLVRNMNSNKKSFNLSHARIKKEYIVVLKKESNE